MSTPEPRGVSLLQQQQQRESAASSAGNGRSSDKPSTSGQEDSSHQSTDTGAAGRSWVGWLLGYSAVPQPSTSASQGDGETQQQVQQPSELSDNRQQRHEEHAESLSAVAGLRADLPGAAVTASNVSRRAINGRVALPANISALPGSLVSPSSPALTKMFLNTSAGSGSLANAKAACWLVAEHAWRLLESGHLASLSQLVQASSFLPFGGLSGLMKQHRDSPYAASGCTGQAASELLKCVTRAVSELPVWTSEEVEMCAVAVERLCREVGAVGWAVAMAVVLVDATTVTAFKQEQPEVWAEFVQLLYGDTSLSYLWEIVEVLTDGVEGEQGSPVLGIEAAGVRTSGRMQGGAKRSIDEAAVVKPYALSGKFAASVGQVELRSLSVARGNNEIEEVSQQSTPRGAIPGPRAGEVSILRM